VTKSKKRGNTWEAEIAAENALLHAAGDARIKKAPDVFRVLGTLKSGRPDVVRARKSEPDFYGLCAGGRFVAFDAKRSTSKARFGLPQIGAKWWHQIEALAEIAALGGLAFLYVLIDSDDVFKRRRFVFPVTADEHVAGVDPRLERSIRLADATPYRVELGETWLDAVAANLQWWQL
jgi:penicillin-binding protein-related factor A (putative recombinase)